MSQNTVKQDIREFWGSLYDSLYDGIDRELTLERLLTGLNDLEDMFRFRGHMAVADMPLQELSGKRVLVMSAAVARRSVKHIVSSYFVPAAITFGQSIHIGDFYFGGTIHAADIAKVVCQYINYIWFVKIGVGYGV